VTPTQRQALIDHLDLVLAEWFNMGIDLPGGRSRLTHITRHDLAAALVDGPLAPVIEALVAGRKWQTASNRAAFVATLDALDPAWLGEP
jgi:hypothetical protein